jgi:hypothetical protein
MMRLLVLAIGLEVGAYAATTDQEVIAVIVGANSGAMDDEPLRFAESDARRFRDLLVELGEVRPQRAILVLGRGAESVLQALNEARGRADELAARGRRVVFIFYYSGHGDDDALHLPRGALALDELRQAIQRVPTDLRLSVLDACRTGGRAKGVHRGPGFALAATPPEPHGTVELRASSIGEAAQESEELAGAVFTHYFLSGLRGAADADGDGRVTLSELYGYIYRQTVFRTGAAAMLQHPALQIDLSGTGEVVLTRPSEAKAFLEVPAGADRYLIFALPNNNLLAEISGAATRRLGLPAGRFLVVRHSEGAAGVASVDLSWGGQKTLGNRDFTPMSREELVARGNHVELRRRRIEPRIGFEYAPGAADSLALRVGPAFGYSRGGLELEIEAAYVGGPVATPAFNGWSHSLSGSVALAIRFLFARVNLVATLGAELRYSFEKLLRIDAARAGAAHLPTEEERSFPSLGPRMGLRLALPLGHHLNADLSANFAALFRQEADSDGVKSIAFHPVIGVILGLGYVF